MAGQQSRRRLIDEKGLLDPSFVGKKYGCLTIATRTTRSSGATLEVMILCERCRKKSFAKFHKIERRVPRGCANCINKFGDHCPEWIYRRVQKQWRRCNDPKTICFERYGGRGIEFKFPSVYEGTCWIVANLGVPTNRKLTLDRIDNDGHYAPGNLQWADVSQQMKNRAKYVRPASRYQRFVTEYPDVGYERRYLDSLFRHGLTAKQIADRWRKRGTS